LFKKLNIEKVTANATKILKIAEGKKSDVKNNDLINCIIIDEDFENKNMSKTIWLYTRIKEYSVLLIQSHFRGLLGRQVFKQRLNILMKVIKIQQFYRLKLYQRSIRVDVKKNFDDEYVIILIIYNNTY